jgi:hypothetical protein
MPDTKDETEQIKVEEISAKINRIIPEELPLNFVNDIIIQHEPDFFMLSFFQLLPPAIIGDTDEEKLQIARSIKTIDSKCVARMVITPRKMRRFLEVISQNLQKYEEKMKSRESVEE